MESGTESMEAFAERRAISGDTRDAESKYRRLHESMADAFVSTDMEGHITEVNRSFESLVDYTTEELLQLTYVDLTPERWHAFEQRIVDEQIMPSGHSEVYEKEYRRKDGSLIPVELRTFLFCDEDGNADGMWAIVRDITERLKLEQALRDSNALLEKRVEERTADLRDSEARFQRLADASFEAISVTENGIIVDINSRYSEMFGWEPEELVGRAVIDFVSPEYRDLVARHIREGYEQAYESAARSKNGEVFPCEVRGKMTEWQGRQLRVTVIRDLTETKLAEAKLAEQRAALARLQRMALVSEISAGIVHQISQPISAILNNVAAARAQVASCDTRPCGAIAILEEINGELDRLRETIDRLRALAHPERQHHSPQFLEPILRDAIRNVEPDARAHNVTLVTNCPDGLPRASADGPQLSQVFINLLLNAIDSVAARPPNHRRVTMTARATADEEIEILIRDSGTGIAPKAAKHLFEPLFTTKEHGIGIGLPFCRTIITAHHGLIEGSNNGDEPGATFRVILPAERGTA